MRTNIVINKTLMAEAMRVSGLTTKKEVVNTALQEFVDRRTRKDISELRGKIRFAEGYDHKAGREDRQHGIG